MRIPKDIDISYLLKNLHPSTFSIIYGPHAKPKRKTNPKIYVCAFFGFGGIDLFAVTKSQEGKCCGKWVELKLQHDHSYFEFYPDPPPLHIEFTHGLYEKGDIFYKVYANGKPYRPGYGTTKRWDEELFNSNLYNI